MAGRGLLTIAILAAALQHAGAQFGGTPGMPDGPPGEVFQSPPSAPPPKCQALTTTRDELQKHGAAIQAANKKKADVRVACRLFRSYIATEAKMLKLLEADGASCGAGPQVIQQVRNSHAKAQQIGKQVCDAAQRPPYQYPSRRRRHSAIQVAPGAKAEAIPRGAHGP